MQHYGKIPSCSVIARDFSLISTDTEPVSIETVRKWLHGSSLPHPKRLIVLQAWLGIDLNNSLIESQMPPSLKNDAPLSIHAIDIAKKIENLSSQKQKAVLEFLETIRKI